MAYLKQFKHDVFISYAHIDNLPDREGQKGWVDAFRDQLKIVLKKRFGQDVSIWRDAENLGGGHLINQEIPQNLRDAGIVLALISERYRQSEYCIQEIAWFCEKAETEPYGLSVDNTLRVFPILLYNIPSVNWPKPCPDALAFKFNTAQDEEEHGRPLAPDDAAFTDGLWNLAERLYDVLKKIRAQADQAQAAGQQEAEPQPTEEASDQEPAFTVFMACAADDLGPTQRQLVRALPSDVHVITDVPPPHDEEAHAEAVRQALKKADLSIHLLSTRPGEPLYEETPEKTYPLEQARLALEHDHAKLILLPKEFLDDDIGQPAYAGFIRDLKARQRDAGTLELVQTGRRQMIDAILARRQAIEEARRLEEQAAEGGATAFIDLHTNDIAYVTNLVGYLAQKKIAAMMIPSANNSPTAGMKMFEKNLKDAALFIIVYGTIDRNWVDYRLIEAFKLIQLNRLKTQMGVYIAPPHKQPDQLQFPPLYNVANNMDGFEPKTLEELLQKTRTA